MAAFERAELHSELDEILDEGLTGRIVIHCVEGGAAVIEVTTKRTPGYRPSRPKVAAGWGNDHSHEDE